MEDKKFKVERVAVQIGCSVHTIDNWYRWKRAAENDPTMREQYAKYLALLPDPIKDSIRQTRFWTKEHIQSLKQFKKVIPKGRNGIMGITTHKGGKNGTKETD